MFSLSLHDEGAWMSNIMKKLDGNVAIVTGGRRGIGKAIALILAEAGATVCICDVVTEDGKLDTVAEEIRQLGRRSVALKVDITQKIEVDNVVREIFEQFGKIDILVNCAGMWLPGKTLLEGDESIWDRVINTNLKGTYFCCQSVAGKMAEQRRGSIINIASDLGIHPIPNIGAYGVAKAGIILLTRQLALELGKYGIRVNAIAPGMVKTDMNIEMRTSPEVEEQMAGKMLLGRLGEPTDIGKIALFLASDGSDHITGQTIVANGGGIIPSLG